MHRLTHINRHKQNLVRVNKAYFLMRTCTDVMRFNRISDKDCPYVYIRCLRDYLEMAEKLRCYTMLSAIIQLNSLSCHTLEKYFLNARTLNRFIS